MKDCTVSIVGSDGKRHEEFIFDASSLMDAAYQALKVWALLAWYKPSAIIEVCADDQTWRVRPERAFEWARKQGLQARR